MTKESPITDIARRYLGVPFHHQGRSKFGIDCVGLVVNVAKALGLSQYDNRTYSSRPDGKTLMKELKSVLVPIPIEEMRNGDILVFWISRRTKAPQHIAFKTEKGMIHTYATVGRVVEHNIGKKWMRRLCGVFRFPGVE